MSDILTAFMVVVPADGSLPRWEQGEDIDLDIERPATAADVRRACLEIAADLNAQAAASYMTMALRAQADIEASKTEHPAGRVKKALDRRKR